jgi:CheY-like chemotaxis protein
MIPKMIKIKADLDENIHIINADPVQIEQVIMNLGVNARDAMPDGGTLSFETTNIFFDENECKKHVDCKPGDYLMLKVSDTGEGIDPEYLERVFEPFFTTKETGKGTGLGLAVVYGILKNHNGFIQCESQKGIGTTFKIYFPVITYMPIKEKEGRAEVPIRRGHETILLVDDEEPIRDSGHQVLSSFGYKVITAEDGENAIQIFEQEKEKIDLVILDLIMPGMGGKHCLERMMQINPKAKVVIASGFSADENTKKSIDKLAKGFVKKPYDMQQILYVARDVLENN